MKPSTRTVPVKTRQAVHIRWMIRRDLDEVLEIEAGSFEYPWSEEDFLSCLRQRHCIGVAAENGERLVGFLLYELHLKWLTVLNFAVAPDSRRLGVGRQMMTYLMGKLSGYKLQRIVLDVRDSNLQAQLFFRSQGFEAVRVLRGYYEDSGADAYRFVYRLGR